VANLPPIFRTERFTIRGLRVPGAAKNATFFSQNQIY
jgi:hypothetical protein